MKFACLYLEQWLGERRYDVYQFDIDPDYARRSTAERMVARKGLSTLMTF